MIVAIITVAVINCQSRTYVGILPIIFTGLSFIFAKEYIIP